MTSAAASVLTVAMLFPNVSAAASGDDRPVSRRIEVRVETLANLVDGPLAPCEVTVAGSASSSRPFTLWSTLGEAAEIGRAHV